MAKGKNTRSWWGSGKPGPLYISATLESHLAVSYVANGLNTHLVYSPALELEHASPAYSGYRSQFFIDGYVGGFLVCFLIN